jgi:hypothetical protein
LSTRNTPNGDTLNKVQLFQQTGLQKVLPSAMIRIPIPKKELKENEYGRKGAGHP